MGVRMADKESKEPDYINSYEEVIVKVEKIERFIDPDSKETFYRIETDKRVTKNIPEREMLPWIKKVKKVDKLKYFVHIILPTRFKGVYDMEGNPLRKEGLPDF